VRLSAQEEYGLRCLLELARQGDEGYMTLPEISRAEGISKEYAAKLMRILRQGGIVKSVRGQAGGYALALPSSQIPVGEALAVLGGRLFEPDFCERHAGIEQVCAHTTDCSLRSLWRMVQLAVDQVLTNMTIKDLLGPERELTPIAVGRAGPSGGKERTTDTGARIEAL
jgi:Rrf2 family protein